MLKISKSFVMIGFQRPTAGNMKEMCHGTFGYGIRCAMAHFTGVNPGNESIENKRLAASVGHSGTQGLRAGSVSKLVRNLHN